MDENIKNYFDKVTEYVECETSGYSFIFDDIKYTKSSKTFYMIVFKVIDHFLKTDSSEIFIQIPTKHLGSGINKQEQNGINLISVLSNVLSLYTIGTLIEDIKPAQEVASSSYYYIDKELDTNGSRGHFIRKPFLKSDEKCILSEIFKPARWDNYRFGELRQQVYDYCPERTYLLNGKVDENSQFGRMQRRIQRSLSFIQACSTCGISTQFKNALIVAPNGMLNNEDLGLPLDGKLFKSPVEFCTYEEFVETKQKNYKVELIVFVGSEGRCSYNKCTDYVRAKLNDQYDALKKVVYIGSNRPETSQDTFAFTFRELLYFFDGMDLPQHKEVPLTFQWLIDSCSELDAILKCDSNLSNDAKREITTRLLYPWICMQRHIEDGLEDRLDIILSEIYLKLGLQVNQNLYNSLAEWLNRQSIQQIENPKEVWLNRTRISGQKFVMPRNRLSYKRKIDTFVVNNTNKDAIVFDGFPNNSFDAYKNMLYKNVRGTYYFLYYYPSALERLHKFQLDEYKIYNSEYRKAVLNNIVCDFHVPTPTIDYISSYIDPKVFDSEAQKSWNSGVKYLISFTDGTSYIEDGEVILDGETIAVEDIESNSYGKYIVYYSKPEDFAKWMDYYRGLPSGKTIYDYALLWRIQLQEMYVKHYAANIDALVSELPGFTRQLMRSYLKDDCPNCFLQNYNQMSQVCNLLKENGYISSEDVGYIINAKQRLTENTSLGRRLKQCLFDIFQKNQLSDNLLDRIITNASARGKSLIVQEMIDKCLFTKQIEKVEEIQ